MSRRYREQELRASMRCITLLFHEAGISACGLCGADPRTADTLLDPSYLFNARTSTNIERYIAINPVAHFHAP